MVQAPRRKRIFDVVGESHAARDDTPRQKILLRCEPGDPILLKRETDNPWDPHAVAVAWRGFDLGYLPREDAQIIARELDAGKSYCAQVDRITGGTSELPLYGMKISLAWDGERLPEPRPLSNAQLASRRARIAAGKRQRDATGAFLGTEKAKGGGCFGVALVALCVPGAAAAARVWA
jgi:hypothetical protein